MPVVALQALPFEMLHVSCSKGGGWKFGSKSMRMNAIGKEPRIGQSVPSFGHSLALALYIWRRGQSSRLIGIFNQNGPLGR